MKRWISVFVIVVGFVVVIYACLHVFLRPLSYHYWSGGGFRKDRLSGHLEKRVGNRWMDAREYSKYTGQPLGVGWPDIRRAPKKNR